MINFRKKSHEANRFKNQSQMIDYQAVTPPPPPIKNRAKPRILCINFYEYFWRGGGCFLAVAINQTQ